jgi:leader peptidase (prepilin peptidase)/N-methyltransferase
MDLLNSSEISNTGFPILLFALVCTFSGSMWINYLYPKALQRDSLSFPEQIQQRGRFRKPALFLALLFFFSKAWSMTAMPALPYIVIAISLLLLMTITDFEQQVILDEMIVAFALSGLCYVFHLQLSLKDHLLASLGGGCFFLFLAFISKGALGGGDIKLIAALGLWLGWRSLLSVILYGAIAGGIAALILLLTKKIKRKQFLAYGPYFALSAIGLMLQLLRGLF